MTSSTPETPSGQSTPAATGGAASPRAGGSTAATRVPTVAKGAPAGSADLSALVDAALANLRHPPSGPAPNRRRAAFSSTLSVDEAALLTEVGYEPLGLVSGSAVFHVGWVSQWQGNSEIPELSQAMSRAREMALSRLRNACQREGGQGVVAVDLTMRGLGSGHGLVEFLAIGTAIGRIADGTQASSQAGSHGKAPAHSSGAHSTPRIRSTTPFTSDCTGKDFVLLTRAGYELLGLVMGSCVYHVAYQSMGAWIQNQTQNTELKNLTGALYSARELAMDRLQSEAIALGANGVVGVTAEERSHVWGSHMIEFFALGTAVRLSGEKHQNLSVVPVVPLDDPRPGVDPSVLTGRRQRR